MPKEFYYLQVWQLFHALVVHINKKQLFTIRLDSVEEYCDHLIIKYNLGYIEINEVTLYMEKSPG